MKKQETAVEWLIEKWKKQGHLYFKDQEQAKELEKQQLETAWLSSEQNMRFQFSSSKYKGISFKQWLEKFKNE